MDKLNLNQFLRYVLAAGVGALAILLSYPCGVRDALEPVSGVEAGVFGLMLIVAGGAIYGVHRSLLHPAISRIILWIIFLVRPHTEARGGRNLLIPTQLELRLIAKRWRARRTPDDAARWGSQVHSLYCSAWAVGAVMLWAPSFLGEPEHRGALPWAFLVALTGAILDDIRLCYSVIVTEIESM